MNKKTLIIILIILIIILISMGIFSFLNKNKPEIVETKIFSEIPGFTFEYSVFKGWEVKEIKKISENEYKILFKCPIEAYMPPSMSIKKSFNAIGYMIPGLSYFINPNKVKYYPIGSSNNPKNKNITFFNKEQDFVIEVSPYLHEGDGYSGKVLADKIIETFKLMNNSESNGVKNINNKEECLKAGGMWGKWGLNPKEVCNLPAKDAGKVCTDSSQCEGQCMAGEDGKGRCSEWKIVVGCHDIVKDGKVTKICID